MSTEAPCVKSHTAQRPSSRTARNTLQVRDLLPQRPELRLVLMSATLNVELFQGYFQGCPLLQVPGYTHPVQASPSVPTALLLLWHSP